MRPYLAFDIEIKRTTDEVAEELKLPDGRDAFNYPHKLGFGIGVIYNSITEEYLAFQSAKEFAKYLLKYQMLLVSFNGFRFDLPVLLGDIDIDTYRELTLCPHIDILADFYKRVGGRFRVSLSNLAMNTLGRDKSGNGADAPILLQQGKVDEVVEYCKNDVALTKELFEFGTQQGYIQYWDNQNEKAERMSVNWSEMYEL